MNSKPLEVLKRGLASLKRQISTKKDHLTTRLKNKQPISEEDEMWLGKGAGNTVDEDCVLDFLEHASNYEQGLQLLSLEDRVIIENLEKLATKPSEVVGSKRALPEKAKEVPNKRRCTCSVKYSSLAQFTEQFCRAAKV
jgi:hypothetical protein